MVCKPKVHQLRSEAEPVIRKMQSFGLESLDVDRSSARGVRSAGLPETVGEVIANTLNCSSKP